MERLLRRASIGRYSRAHTDRSPLQKHIGTLLLSAGVRLYMVGLISGGRSSSRQGACFALGALRAASPLLCSPEFIYYPSASCSFGFASLMGRCPIPRWWRCPQAPARRSRPPGLPLLLRLLAFSLSCNSPTPSPTLPPPSFPNRWPRSAY